MNLARARKQVIVARSPAQCSAAEIKAFIGLASNSGEVAIRHMERGVRQAKYVLWIDAEEIAPCAVAALKAPLQNYQKGVFRKARSPLNPTDYPLEFGYAFTDERRRRRGHGRALISRAIELAKNLSVHATVRSDNSAMRTILEASGFRRSGNAYPSSKRDALLMLFIKAACDARLHGSHRSP